MATRAGIDPTILNRLDDDHSFIFYAVKAEFDTDTVAVHSYTGEITFGGTTYEGAGTLLGISPIEDNADLSSSGAAITLSGLNKEVLNLALTETYQNRPITIFQGFLDGGGSNVTGTLVLFKGRIQNLKILDTPDGLATISLDAENRLIDLKRPSNLRYTKESQEFVSSGDTGFNRVDQMVDKKLVWGQKEYGGTGSFDSVDDPDFHRAGR